MSGKNNQKFIKESDKSHVRMYKTGHGWVAALTRLLQFLHLKGVSQVETHSIEDPDALKSDNRGGQMPTLKAWRL